MAKNGFAFAVVAFCLIFPVCAQADTSPIEPQPYSQGATRKLGRGIANLLFGWIDIFSGVEDTAKNNGAIAAVTYGPLYGLGKAVVRTAAGAYEIVTFPIPAPPDFEPLVEPEFPMSSKNDG